jgi:hypothetical protein
MRTVWKEGSVFMVVDARTRTRTRILAVNPTKIPYVHVQKGSMVLLVRWTCPRSKLVRVLRLLEVLY